MNENLKGYLVAVSEMQNKCSNGAHSGLEGIYLNEGKEFSKRPLTPQDEIELLEFVKNSKYKQKECWKNATKIALDSTDTIKFCEGFGVSHRIPIPIHHAWISFKGRAIDVTWGKEHVISSDANILKRIKKNIAESEYFGVEITKSELIECIHETMVYDSVVRNRLNKELHKKV